MATLLLRQAGSAVGTLIGGPLGGIVGGALGAVGGAVLDETLARALAPRKKPPAAIDTLPLTGSAEGAPVRKLWGRMRLGGNVIWCAQFQSFDTKAKASSGKGSGASATTTHYSLSFAVAFCEGAGDVSLGRIWADGVELDRTQYGYAFYNGSESQGPDSWIEAVEGTGAVPAYRGTCYIVFHDMALDAFGNRMPQLTAELIRMPPVTDPDDLTQTLRSVALLPGSGEFAYGTTEYQSSDGFGNWFPENVHGRGLRPDVLVSLDQFSGGTDQVAAVASPAAVSLVVTWFGSDLRAGACQIVPKVETATKTVKPADWAVAGFTRATAAVVSSVDPAVLDPTGLGGDLPPSGAPVPAFGGTPSDDTVIQAIGEMNGRGLRVMFYPFVMMDIPTGNGLPDPYGGAEQAAYPWRGRVTCHPAPGRPGSPDKTAEAAAEVAAFFAQFAAMVLHYAGLCVEAGGVDAFVIGSEFVGLTQVRASPGDGTYPAIAALKSLAAQVKTIVGASCRVGYAADWTEYHAHRPADGSNDVIFNMDPLWSDPNLDFIGIDNYLPLSDWRDGAPNIDAVPGGSPNRIYDRDYLRANVEGGEDYDWYYASAADRVAQHRTPILDTAYARHWVFRQKDIRSWWCSAHVSRPGGVEGASATAFVPMGKPIWMTEFGCPAVDKGPNQPNVFFDPKSSESFLPYFSTGSKDDPVQRAALEATLSYWRDHAPTSPVYGGPMLDTANMFAWAWDARPYPEFPGFTSVWRDTPNYELGHWLTGRLAEVPLKWIIAELCAAAGVAAFDTTGLLSAGTLVPGYATDGVATPRDMLASLMDAFMFDASESGGVLRFFARGNVAMTPVEVDGLAVESGTDIGFGFTRVPETDLPGALRLSFVDPYRNYAVASVEARKASGSSQNVAALATPAVLDEAYAAGLAESLLQQVWAARETGTAKLPPSRVALDPGDGLALDVRGVTRSFRIKAIETTTLRSLTLDGFDPSLLSVAAAPRPKAGAAAPVTFGAPIVEFMDLPVLAAGDPQPWAPRVAAYASPWSGLDVYRGNGGGFDLLLSVETPAAMGELTAPLGAGPPGRWDRANAVSVRFYGAASLLSLGEAAVLGGAGALAVRTMAGWEVLQYRDAALAGRDSYRLTTLLRGQLGTEGAMGAPAPAGSRVVVLDPAALPTLPLPLDARGLAQVLRFGPSARPLADATYAQATVAFAGVGLRPFSPSQLSGRRSAPGADVLFSWVRRTRFAGDAWDPDTVPLNEDAERYDLEILSGAGALVRTASGLAAPAWTYAAADQGADWGAAQPAYTLNVYQLSALYGRGRPATATVTL